MLNDADIAWMKETRKEVVKGRETLITLDYTSAGTKDEFTDEVIPGEPATRDVMSVVTEISSTAGTGSERVLISGIAFEKGDVWLSIDFDLVADIHTFITRLRYDGQWYTVLASDKKGIGAINRVEILGRLTT